MSIQELATKFKGFVRSTECALAVLIVAVSLASFGLGRLSVDDRGMPLEQYAPATVRAALPSVAPPPVADREATVSTPPASTPPEGGYVASKNGTKYHLPWCSGAKQISEQNKLFFATKAEAEAAGYTPASNCKGI